jgi:N-dimethylarginine dimethylaminohydrolase
VVSATANHRETYVTRSPASLPEAEVMSRRILMCSPEHYGIEYEINPWMSRARQADQALALEQWTALRQILINTGVETPLVEPVAGLPDLVFTANAALIYRQQAVLSHFRHPERQKEEGVFRRWFEANGFTVVESPPGMSFEGAGDALFCGDTLFAGYRMRSDALGHQQIAAMLDCRVIPLELVDPYYYHLDTCFCPLAANLAAWYPAAFDDYGRRVIRELIDELIEVEEEEAKSFACNAVVVGHHVITNTGCPNFHAALHLKGFNPLATPLGEFVKAGGSAKCLTLRLDGEEAAAWAKTDDLQP